jgi:hypothetical protein
MRLWDANTGDENEKVEDVFETEVDRESEELTEEA